MDGDSTVVVVSLVAGCGGIGPHLLLVGAPFFWVCLSFLLFLRTLNPSQSCDCVSYQGGVSSFN